MFADEDLHRHAAENVDQADALLFGRVTYEMMEAAFRSSARTGARPDWMEPCARTIRRGKKVRRVEHPGLRNATRYRLRTNQHSEGLAISFEVFSEH
jgi:hypothetical protein